MSELHIFVNNQGHSMQLCRTLLKNIADINAAGMRLRIHKVLADPQTVASLQSIGVQRIPSMIIPSGQIINGVAKIVEVIKDIVNGSPTSSSAKSYASLDDMYAQEMRDHVKNGGIDEDGPDDDTKWDPSKAVNEYAKNNTRHSGLKPIWHESAENANKRPANMSQESQIDAGFVADLEDNDADTELLLKQLLG